MTPRHVTILLLFCTAALGCSKPSRAVHKGDRTLGIKANIGEAGGYARAFKESISAGSETQELPFDWNELEVAPHKFEPTPNFLAIANRFYPAHGVPVHLMIRPVHTNQKVVPTDLRDAPLNAPETIARFRALIDWVSTQVPALAVTSVAVGSEIDVYAWGDPERWREWTDFYAAVAPHVRHAFPGALVATETTHHAFLGSDVDRLRELHRHGDAVGVSYYPMKAGLSGAREPNSVHRDFDAIVNAIDDKPLLFYQIGYPSSPALGSSPERQAAFIREAFRAWDRHAARIDLLNFQWVHETPPAGLDHYAAYYGNESANFREFLGSLGFQSWSGEPKPAWAALHDEANRRAFGAFR